jgi:hypothetical protein
MPFFEAETALPCVGGRRVGGSPRPWPQERVAGADSDSPLDCDPELDAIVRSVDKILLGAEVT